MGLRLGASDVLSCSSNPKSCHGVTGPCYLRPCLITFLWSCSLLSSLVIKIAPIPVVIIIADIIVHLFCVVLNGEALWATEDGDAKK